MFDHWKVNLYYCYYPDVDNEKIELNQRFLLRVTLPLNSFIL